MKNRHVLAGRQADMAGRRLSQTLRLIRDVLSFIQDRKLNTVIANLNLEKAYNRIEHKFLSAVLNKMGFLEKTIKWIKLLYSKLRSQILVKGQLSKSGP